MSEDTPDPLNDGLRDLVKYGIKHARRRDVAWLFYMSLCPFTAILVVSPYVSTVDNPLLAILGTAGYLGITVGFCRFALASGACVRAALGGLHNV